MGYFGAAAPRDFVPMVQHAESLGFHSVWTAEAYGSDSVVPLTWVAASLVGVSSTTAWSVGWGWVLGYAFYEWLHMACHLWGPRTAYGAFVRRHHFHHHFGAPLRNHGVTSPVWDHVFGTYDRVEQVVVPRRLAFRWLLDDDGEVRPEHRSDYEVRGRKPLVKEEELEVAFSNEAPALV